MRQTLSYATDDVVIGDAVLAPLSRPTTAPWSIELAGRPYSCSKAYWVAIPGENRPVCLTSDVQLAEMTAGGGQTLIADVRSMAPGWRSWLGYLLTNADSRRILLSILGCRFPVTDSWGLGCYFKVVVVDLDTKKTIFQEGYPAESDVAISPDGRLVGVIKRAQRRLTLHQIP